MCYTLNTFRKKKKTQFACKTVFFSPLFSIQPLHEQANNCSEIIQPEEHLYVVIKEMHFS